MFKRVNFCSCISLAALLLPVFLVMGQMATATTTTSTDSPPVPAEDVSVQFYMCQLNLWTEQGLEAKFKAAVARALTGFCIGNFSACGFNTSNIAKFTGSSIRISPGSPTNVDSHYLRLRLSISFNLPGNGEADSKFILPTAQTAAILENYRMSLYDSIGYYIVYIDAQFYSIPPPNFINLIIVSAFGGFTLLLIITALTLRSCVPEESRKLLKKSHKDLETLVYGPSIAGLTTDTAVAAAAAAAVAAGAASTSYKDASRNVEDSIVADEAMLNPGYRNSVSEEPGESQLPFDCATAEQIELD